MFEATPQRIWWPPPEGGDHRKKLTDAVDTPSVAKAKTKRKPRIKKTDPLFLRGSPDPLASARAANAHGSEVRVWTVQLPTFRRKQLRQLVAGRTNVGRRTTAVRLLDQHIECTIEVSLTVWAAAGGHRIDQALNRVAVLDQSQLRTLTGAGNRLAVLGELRARDRARLDAIVEHVMRSGRASRGAYERKGA
jgi:hypothetical protein